MAAARRPEGGRSRPVTGESRGEGEGRPGRPGTRRVVAPGGGAAAVPLDLGFVEVRPEAGGAGCEGATRTQVSLGFRSRGEER